jgi:hypothetical protein
MRKRESSGVIQRSEWNGEAMRSRKSGSYAVALQKGDGYWYQLAIQALVLDRVGGSVRLQAPSPLSRESPQATFL